MNLAIVGGGAAGFMAAITAAETFPEARITLLEKNADVLGKVRISGGGRCNVTNAPATSSVFARNYPRGEAFMKKILAKFSAADTIRWFENRGVKLKTEADGRVFPETNSSQTIIDCLLNSAFSLGIHIRRNAKVESFSKNGNVFILTFANESLEADRLMICCGGFPKENQFSFLSAHGIEVKPPVPSLFTFNIPLSPLVNLQGVSLPEAFVKIRGSKLEAKGPMLVTHWGLSGPAILGLSAWGARELAERTYRFRISLNMLPNRSENEVREALFHHKETGSMKQVASHTLFGLPHRLWLSICRQAQLPEAQRWHDIPNKSLHQLTHALTQQGLDVTGKTTFKEEFVTCGGVSLRDISHETMESLSIKSLFFAGEILDVDGLTGGFNFQNAWTTGFIAGTNLGLPSQR